MLPITQPLYAARRCGSRCALHRPVACSHREHQRDHPNSRSARHHTPGAISRDSTCTCFRLFASAAHATVAATAHLRPPPIPCAAPSPAAKGKVARRTRRVLTPHAKVSIVWDCVAPFSLHHLVHAPSTHARHPPGPIISSSTPLKANEHRTSHANQNAEPGAASQENAEPDERRWPCRTSLASLILEAMNGEPPRSG